MQGLGGLQEPPCAYTSAACKDLTTTHHTFTGSGRCLSTCACSFGGRRIIDPRDHILATGDSSRRCARWQGYGAYGFALGSTFLCWGRWGWCVSHVSLACVSLILFGGTMRDNRACDMGLGGGLHCGDDFWRWFLCNGHMQGMIHIQSFIRRLVIGIRCRSVQKCPICAN